MGMVNCNCNGGNLGVGLITAPPPPPLQIKQFLRATDLLTTEESEMRLGLKLKLDFYIGIF